tara:strand:+ start:2925 stop:3344 length:420 start_codon:yes stop_codon:yes gene_type:complete
MFILEVWSTRKSYSSELFETQDEAAQALTYARGAEDFRKGSITVVTAPEDLAEFGLRAREQSDRRQNDRLSVEQLPQHPTLGTTTQADRPGARHDQIRKASMVNCGQATWTETTSAKSASLNMSLPETYRHYASPRKTK